MADLAPLAPRHVARHRERLEIHFRTHHGGSAAEERSALEILDDAREDQKIAQGRLPQRSPVAIRVLVGDVVPDPHVHGRRNVRFVRSSEDREVLVREVAGGDELSHRLSEPEPFGVPCPDDVVELRGLLPMPEPPVEDILGDRLRRRPYQRQLEIVDRARPVHRNDGDPLATYEVADVAGEALLYHVRPHHQHDARSAANPLDHRIRDPRERGVFERYRHLAHVQDKVEIHQVGPLAQRADIELSAIELFKFARHCTFQVITG